MSKPMFVYMTVVGLPTTEETEKAARDLMDAALTYVALRARQRGVEPTHLPCLHCQEPLGAGVDIVVADSDDIPIVEVALVHPACAEEMRRRGELKDEPIERSQ